MGLLDAIGKVPGLHYVFEAATGRPSPYTLEQVKTETENAIRHGLRTGVNRDGSSMTQAQKDAVVSDVHRQQEDFLKSHGQHPSQAAILDSVGVQGLIEPLRKAAAVVMLVAASGLTLFFGFKFYQTIRRR